jgi:pimeloyl-ACP methyl ester carboxylesterase
MGPVTDEGTDIAIVWIQGAMCDNAGYESIAAEVQAQGVALGQRIFVGIPDFIAGSPDPVTLPGKVNSTVKALRELGFSGDNIVMAGHSLGGVMAQGYTEDHADTVKAQVLMGSVLTREKREILDDGNTQFNYGVPTMSVAGSKDGLLRLSRAAEQFWHTNINISAAQLDMFPTIAFEGVSHAQFTSGSIPINVRNHDLVPDVPEATAHSLTANAMVHFFDQIIMGNEPTLDIAASQHVLQGMVDAMELEGYYGTKPGCDLPPYLINPETITCLHGSPWNAEHSQRIMGGDLPGTNMSINSNDNFHPVD